MPICECGWKYKSDRCPMCGAAPKQHTGVGLPNKGNPSRLARKSRINAVGKAKRRRLKKQGSELEVFLGIYQRRPHVCQNKRCGKSVDTFHPEHFHHVKSKGAHPELRYDPQNIVLVCRDCHTLAHQKGNDALMLPDNPAIDWAR